MPKQRTGATQPQFILGQAWKFLRVPDKIFKGLTKTPKTMVELLNLLSAYQQHQAKAKIF